MRPDYHDAFNRHSRDAEALFSGARWANADHLFGLAAECGLKRLMLAFGMQMDSTGNKPDSRDDQSHADRIWDRFEHYRAGHGAVHYMLPSVNPFMDWDASQRYAPQSNFDRVRVAPHRSASEEVRKLLQKALLEGII